MNSKVGYHVTHAHNVDGIFGRGLRRGGFWHGRNPSVYFVETLGEAQEVATCWGDGALVDREIVCFAIPDDVKIIRDMEGSQDFYVNCYRIEENVPKENVLISFPTVGNLKYRMRNLSEPKGELK